ncbi:MAG TPA: hypothetical protein VH475_22130 [Tepidisphaeraceae bacterium]|jgi:hypothetical protein
MRFAATLLPVSLTCAVLALVTLVAPAALAERHKPVTAGNLTLNPAEIVAVFRPVDQQAVAILVGRPGQALETIIFRDAREASQIFNELWDNNDLCKDAGDEDAAKPLTRMIPKGSDRRLATLLVNMERLVAVAWDTEHRVACAYLDRPIATALVDPNTGEQLDHLVVPNTRQEAEAVLAAYRASVYLK